MKKLIYVLVIAISLITMCGCEKDQLVQVAKVETRDTGFILIVIDPIVPNFTKVGGYKLSNEYFMPDCQDLQSGTRTIDVDVTNITYGFYPDKRAKYHFNSCK